jgi:pimeloyl-ACP methyl ester carboxylesterase
MTDKPEPEFLDGPHGRLAILRAEGKGPPLLWLGGYASDMRGTKAEAVHGWASERGRAFVRFDYSGHGESEGAFEEGTIGRWVADARAVRDATTDGPAILVGSSMGAWIAGLLAREAPERAAALVLLAPAPDFTEELTRTGWTEEERARLERDGRIAFPSPYDDTETVYTRALFEDGARHLLLRAALRLSCPVRILQGTADEAVPWRHAVRFAEHVEAADVTVTLVKGADHRLSAPADIARLLATLDAL